MTSIPFDDLEQKAVEALKSAGRTVTLTYAPGSITMEITDGAGGTACVALASGDTSPHLTLRPVLPQPQDIQRGVGINCTSAVAHRRRRCAPAPTPRAGCREDRLMGALSLASHVVGLSGSAEYPASSNTHICTRLLVRARTTCTSLHVVATCAGAWRARRLRLSRPPSNPPCALQAV